MDTISELANGLINGNRKALSRCISIVENDSEGSSEILASLKYSQKTPLIGITGPPGAGKSTLVNAIVQELVSKGKKVGVLAVDPTSPFHGGALLGDRLRMTGHFLDPNVYIRSLASRGFLGGLSAKAIEVTDLMRAAGFDYILIETVGVGQSEVEIAGLADITVLVLVPESGDEIQTIKSGIMEIPDVFVVNKSDREGAGKFVSALKSFIQLNDGAQPVIQTIASEESGIKELVASFDNVVKKSDEQKRMLIVEKVFRLIQQKRMINIDKDYLNSEIKKHMNSDDFNIYNFASEVDKLKK